MKYQVNIARVVVDRGGTASAASARQPAQEAARRVLAAAPGLHVPDLDGRIAAALTQAVTRAVSRRTPR
jgi:hypothetical protein